MSAFDWIKALFGHAEARESKGLRLATGLTEQTESSSQTFYSIENAWRDHLAPVIRELGFKGSGRNFRMVTEQFALAVNLQGSGYGGKFTVNLGVQPLAIGNVTGDLVDARNFKEIECAFRERLTADGKDTWWSYTQETASMSDAAQSAAALFRRIAMSQFNDRMNFALFTTPETVVPASPMMLVSLALLRETQGNLSQAKAFALMARESATKNWIIPKSIRHLL